MGATKSHILNLLEMRFDFQSARNVLNNWRKFAQIKDDSDDLNDDKLKSLLAYLQNNAPDATRVMAAVERLILANDVEPNAPAVENIEQPAENIENVAESAESAESAEVSDSVETAEIAETTDSSDTTPADDSAEQPQETGKKKGKKSRH